MSKNPRCKQCKKKYSKKNREYFVVLKNMYIRVGASGKKWVKIGYWCPNCHRFYEL